MIEEIKVWIVNIVTVIIFISFLEILMPDGKMKKYLNLILGFVVMLAILNPVMGLLNSNSYLEDEFFKISNDLIREEYIFSAKNIESVQQEQLLTLYKSKIIDDIKQRVESKYSVNVLSIDIDLENKNKENIGEINSIKLAIKENEGVKENNEIPIVSISVFDETQDINNDNTFEVGLRNKIRQDISETYSIENQSIIIN